MLVPDIIIVWVAGCRVRAEAGALGSNAHCRGPAGAPRDQIVRSANPFIVCLLILGVFSQEARAQSPPRVTPAITEPRQGTDVLGAFSDSMKLLMIEHGTRIAFQSKTRKELGGNFWEDYSRSVRVPPQWEDTDSWAVNYIGHPIHGAAAGYLWLDHEHHAPREFSVSSNYWTSRGRATAWAAAYSLQFEIGPLSEASIGNVGMDPATTGWVDHVVTPIGAFGLIVAEDAVDRWFVKWVEARMGNTVARGALRVALNPGRALANASSGRMPWHRGDRALDWGR